MSSVLAAGPLGLLLPGHVSNTPPSQFAVPNGLVGYWGFDADCLDFTAAKAFDLSGNGRTGTIASGTLDVGQVGQALAFNTTTVPGIDLGSWSNSLANISVCAWVKPSDAVSRYDYVAKWFTAPSGYKYNLLQGVTPGTFQFFISIDGSAGVSSPVSATYTAGTWYFLCGTFDGATIRLFLNGVEQGAGTAQAGSIFTGSTASDTIGGSADVVACVASIDDVRIYNRALDPWEVITLYRAGLQGRRDAGQRIPQAFDLMTLRLGGVSAYTLTATQGAYTLSGKAATPNSARSIAAALGTYSLSGKAITLNRGIRISAAQGTFTVNGIAASLPRARTMAAAQGAFTVSGIASGLFRGRTINAAQGAFAVNGVSAKFPVALSLKAVTGAYTVNGTSTVLTYTPTGGGGGTLPHSLPFFVTVGPLSTK
jgi:hypothetical protein